MALCIDYNCDDPIGTPIENTCGKEFIGDFSAAVLFLCGYTTTDPSDEAQVQADITAGLAVLITGAGFSIEDPAPTEVDSVVPCRPKTITKIERTGNYLNPNVNSTNDDFHDVLFSGKVFGAILLYECQSNRDGYAQSKYIDAQLSFTGGLNAKPGTTQQYGGKFNWNSFSNPKTVVTPAGIFS